MTPRAPAPVRFVYFDLDDTLLDHRAAERAALADCCRDLAALAGRDPHHVAEVYHRHNAPLWREYAAGRVSREEVQRLRFERTLAELEVETDSEAVGTHYLSRYAEGWRWTGGAEQAWRATAERFPVGIITNGFSEIQHAKLDRFPALREHARHTLISEEFGVMKPHAELFAHAAEQAGCAPGELVYVGDSLRSDVEGAEGAGWTAAWYRPEGGPPRDGTFQFRAWPELLDWLGVA